MQKINIELDTNFIPYEIRRNPLKMFYMDSIYYSNNKLYKTEFPKEFNNIFSTNINEHLTYKIIENPVIIFFQRFKDNYGHFIFDNLIPLFKLICTHQQNLYPKNELVLYLYKKDNSQKLNDKWEKLLECFVCKVEYFNENLCFKKAIIANVSLEQPWKSKIIKSINNNIFMDNFIDIIYKKFEINRISDPKEINFLSRKNAKWRRILNENEINYTKICFEDISINEEIEIINKTKILITPYGAGIVSGFFLNKNSTIIIIYPPNFSYTRDCSIMELYLFQHLGIKTICCTNDCKIINTTIYEKDNTDDSIIQYRDKDFKININNLNNIIENIL